MTWRNILSTGTLKAKCWPCLPRVYSWQPSDSLHILLREDGNESPRQRHDEIECIVFSKGWEKRERSRQKEEQEVLLFRGFFIFYFFTVVKYA